MSFNYIFSLILFLQVGSFSLPIEGTLETSDDPVERYIEDLIRFVRDVQSEKHRPESYWQEVDKLWEALQLRKENLEGSIQDRQFQKIRRWENRYRRLRNNKHQRT